MANTVEEGRLYIHGESLTDKQVKTAYRLLDDLKPCPFCGCTEPLLANTHTTAYWVECPDCGAEVPDRTRSRSHGAAMIAASKAWNRRASEL